LPYGASHLRLSRDPRILRNRHRAFVQNFLPFLESPEPCFPVNRQCLRQPT